MVPFLFEAVVVDPAPDGAPVGHVKVKIPTLFRDSVVPFTIAPLIPGMVAGGWQSAPGSATTPEGEPTRVIIIKVADSSFRWIGTSQIDPWIASDATKRAGARSPDGRHVVRMSDDGGVYIAAVVDTPHRMSISPDGGVELLNDAGGGVSINPAGKVEVSAPAGQSIVLSGGGTTGGTPIIREGDSTAGHQHTLSGTAGPYPLSGIAVTTVDTMAIGTGNQKVKA